MIELFRVTYNGGTDGATVPNAGSGGEWDTVTGTGTAVYSAASAVEGANGVLITGSRQMRKTISATNKWRLRWYHEQPVIDPSSANTPIAVGRLAGAIRAQVRLDIGGVYQLTNLSSATGSPSANLVANVGDRLEWAVDGDAGTQTLYIFRGANKHGATADASISGTYTNSTIDDLGAGLFTNIASFVVKQDAVVATDTPGALIGGAIVSVNAEVATATGTAGAPAASVVANAESAEATGAALFDPTGSVVDLALVSDNPVTVIGTADDPSVSLRVNAEVATGTGAANDATVSTTGPSLVFVSAGLASGTGAAYDLSVLIVLPPPAPPRMIYRGPTRVETWPIAPGERLCVRVTVNQTLYRVNGLWRIGENLSYVELDGADRVYQGGYEFELTQAQADELILAGLGQYVIEIPADPVPEVPTEPEPPAATEGFGLSAFGLGPFGF